MKELSRRGMLRVAGASAIAPVAARVQSKTGEMQLAGLHELPINTAEPVAGSDSPTKFRRWADYIQATSDALKRDAKNVHSLDPDILGFHLPLITKVRMQRQRNYERLLAERKDWFDRTLKRFSIVETWL